MAVKPTRPPEFRPTGYPPRPEGMEPPPVPARPATISEAAAEAGLRPPVARDPITIPGPRPTGDPSGPGSALQPSPVAPRPGDFRSNLEAHARSLSDIQTALEHELQEAERKAWDTLSRYKFVMFGYWCGVWVHLNRLAPVSKPNPWRGLVAAARGEMANNIRLQKAVEGKGESEWKPLCPQPEAPPESRRND